MDGICTIHRCLHLRLLLLGVSSFSSQDLGSRFVTTTSPLLLSQQRQNHHINVDSDIVPPTHISIPPVLSKTMLIQARLY